MRGQQNNRKGPDRGKSKKKGENGRKEVTEQLEICVANKTIEKVQIEVSQKKRKEKKGRKEAMTT